MSASYIESQSRALTVSGAIEGGQEGRRTPGEIGDLAQENDFEMSTVMGFGLP